MDKEDVITLVFIITVVIGFMTLIVIVAKAFDKELKEQEQQVKEQIIDCQSRGNELKWCLDVIK